MSKQRKPNVNEEDFRSRRVQLKAEHFALSSGKHVRPTDLVRKKCWRNLTALPDDVSLRTSDHFGSILGSVEELWGESICLAYALQKISNTSAVAHTVGDAVDHFQASIYNALTGYYRLGFTSLRAVVENMTLAAYFDIAATHDEFAAWLAGEDFRFGRAADNLLQYAHIADLEEKLRVATGDNLYRQRTETDPGGFVRRLFRELSKFAHGAPGYSDGDMWRSNRPIFVAEVFETWTEYFLAVYSLTVLQSRLADQQLRHLAFDSAFTARELFRHVIQRMSRKSEARTLLGALPDDIW